MILDITWEDESVGLEQRETMTALLYQALEEALKLSGRPAEAEISLLFVDDSRIRTLNLAYRGIDAPTDVLSFALQEEMEEEPDLEFADQMLGDIVISLPRARAQAEEYGHSLERELIYLAVHGTLHLLGYDHEEEAAKQEMRRREEEVMAALSLERD